ncbi:MAG: thiol reductant ABC exporter subunit CydC [Alicyclobacillaceae bacterium]|nr:thiol reductant ABC exporter subunit CydC [Alicyclobacillaceae bacterium]
MSSPSVASQRPATLLLWKWLRPYTWRAIFAAFLALLTFASNFGLLGVSGLLISKAALHPANILLLFVPLVAVRFFGLARAAFRYAERYVEHDFAFRVLVDIRDWLYRTLSVRVPLLHQTHQGGDVLAAAVDDIDTLQFFYIRTVAPGMAALAGIVLASLTLGFLLPGAGWTVAAGLSIAGFGLPLMLFIYRRRLGRTSRQKRAQLSALLTDAAHGLRDIQNFGREEWFQSRLQALSEDIAVCDMRLGTIEAMARAAFSAGQGVTVFTVGIMGVRAVLDQHYPAVDLAMVVLFTMAAFESVSPLFSAFEQAGQTFAALHRVHQLGDIPARTTVPNPAPAASFKAGTVSDLAQPTEDKKPHPVDLSLTDVCFRYPKSRVNQLQHIDLHIPAGKKVAIVGASGCGKSTLLKVILGLWPATSGQVTRNGHLLEEVPTETLRETFGVVTEADRLFRLSIADNIRLGRPDASLQEVRNAARMAHIDDAIESLPDGYDTVLTEGGLDFSGGERQRMALARALLTKAPILIFDEPTAHLDDQTERAFYATLKVASAGRSILLVTHREQGLRDMDEILVMDNGSIVERGTYAELTKSNGYFARLYGQSPMRRLS